MISASVGVNSSLLLEPAQTLTFALDGSSSRSLQSATTACLTLTNISPRKHVVFKVRTTNVDMFMVKPAQGVIEPGGEVAIVVTLLAESSTRLLATSESERDAIIERFLIQSIDRSDDMRGFSVADDLNAFWKRIPKELITKKKLTCRFIQAHTVEPVHLPPPRIRLQTREEETKQQLQQMKPFGSPAPPRSPASRHNHSQNQYPYQQQQPRTTASAVQELRRDQRRGSATSVSSAQESQYPQYQQQPPLPPRSPPRSPPRAFSYSSAPQMESYGYSSDLNNSNSDNGSSNSSSNNTTGPDLQEMPFPRESRVSSRDSYATRLSLGDLAFDERLVSEEIREFRLHPSESLTFPVHLSTRSTPASGGNTSSANGRMEGRSYFFITNKSVFSGLAFKIKTSNQSGYFVKPARGLINATSAQRIDVFVNAPDAALFDAHERERRDRFLVELLFVEAAAYQELAPLPEDVRREELQRLWEDDKRANDRRQAVLKCQILEQNAPVDPSRQTADQARALLQKSYAATSLSFNSGRMARADSGETANPFVHPPSPLPPVPPRALEPRIVARDQEPLVPNQSQNQSRSQYYYQQQQQQHERSPVHRDQDEQEYYPRSPGRPHQPRSPVHQQQHQYHHQPRSPVHQQHQSRSPVHQQHQPRSPVDRQQYQQRLPRSPVHHQQPQQRSPVHGHHRSNGQHHRHSPSPVRTNQHSSQQQPQHGATGGVDSDNETFYV